jgi:RNA polymerase sigma factor (sigma-70 family)
VDTTRIIEQLIEDDRTLVFHVIYSLTGQWEDSQDLTQETFLHALRGIEAARAASGSRFQARAWLLRIAVNLVHMQHRREPVRCIPLSALARQDHQVEQASPVALSASLHQGAQDPAILVAERDLVQRCLGRLPETLRVPLLLQVVAGFSSREIARLLTLREATVRQRLTRGRKLFERFYGLETGLPLRPSVAPGAASRTRSRAHRSPARAAAALSLSQARLA